MSRRPGLSLIEMLIAIAILSILIGLLLGAVQKVRMSGSKLTLSNKTRQIALSVHNIISTDNRLPAQCEWDKYQLAASCTSNVECRPHSASRFINNS